MVEAPQEEITLRDIVEVLKRHRVYLWTFPLLFGAVALIYGFFIAEPTYASTATLSVAPVQVQAQLEQRIQVQQATLITFEGLKALALSEEVVGGVWEVLRQEGRLPTRWQDQGNLRGVERMLRDLQVKDISPKVQAANPNQVPPIVAAFTVKAPDPQVAAKAANLWVEAVKRRVNAILLARLEANLEALEEQIAPAEKTYREAQARFEAFQRTSTLAQDLAELEALTGERASANQVVVSVEPRLLGERVLLARELAGLERDLAAVRSRIRFLEQEVRRSGKEFPDLPRDLLEAKREEAELLARKAAIEARIAQVDARINVLKDRVARAQVEQDTLSQALELAKNAYLALAQKRTDLEIQIASSQVAWASILAPAYPVYEKVAPRWGLLFALAVALGLMLGVMAAFVAETLRPQEAPSGGSA